MCNRKKVKQTIPFSASISQSASESLNIIPDRISNSTFAYKTHTQTQGIGSWSRYGKEEKTSRNVVYEKFHVTKMCIINSLLNYFSINLLTSIYTTLTRTSTDSQTPIPIPIYGGLFHPPTPITKKSSYIVRCRSTVMEIEIRFSDGSGCCFDRLIFTTTFQI